MGLIIALLALAASFFAPDTPNALRPAHRRGRRRRWRRPHVIGADRRPGADGEPPARPEPLSRGGDHRAARRFVACRATGRLGRMARGLCCLDRADGVRDRSHRSSDFAALSNPAKFDFSKALQRYRGISRIGARSRCSPSSSWRRPPFSGFSLTSRLCWSGREAARRRPGWRSAVLRSAG